RSLVWNRTSMRLRGTEFTPTFWTLPLFQRIDIRAYLLADQVFRTVENDINGIRLTIMSSRLLLPLQRTAGGSEITMRAPNILALRVIGGVNMRIDGEGLLMTMIGFFPFSARLLRLSPCAIRLSLRSMYAPNVIEIDGSGIMGVTDNTTRYSERILEIFK